MKKIHQTYEIHAPIGKVWRALVDAKYIDNWGGGPAVMDEAVGTEFSLWNGDIYGKNIEVIPEKKLVQEWYGGDWPQPSIATFTLSESDGVTTVELLHVGMPGDEVTNFEEGWKDYYLGPLKEYVEKK
ncbi:MAG: SRPBCC domain-containing protein [Candidatus Kerfeldbacteria bacterium]|nr:SRPBCC domain-containing protein [Candidatus Kerfeldbacteria bacterium]